MHNSEAHNTLSVTMGTLWFLLLMLIITPSLAWATSNHKVDLPTPLGYVSDYAQVVSPQWRSQIRSVSKDLEERTGVEMIIVIMPTIEPLKTAQNYASELYKGWRIGTAQQERGILLLAAIKERQAVVVLGRNLFSVVSKKQLDEISTRYLRPMYQTNDYGPNLYRAAVQLSSVSGEIKPLSNKKKKSGGPGFWMNLAVVFVMLYILWRFTRPERGHPFRGWRRGEYWGTGQGGFGGNFGGFGGGMSGNGLG